MNKLLLGTTALFGAVALSAGAAVAETPKVTVGGFLNFQAGFVDEDLDTNKDDMDFRNDTEIHFNVDAKSDSGLAYGGVVELESDATNDVDGEGVNADKTYVYLQGGWGRLEAGSNVGATNTLKVDASTFAAATGGIHGDFYKYISTPSTAGSYVILPDLYTDHGVLTTGGTYAAINDAMEDATKLTYYSPRVYGFQLGLSFTPDTGDLGQTITGSNASGQAEDVYGIGLNYTAQYDALSIEASVTGEFGETENTATDDLSAYAIGLNLGYAGFTLGGSWGEYDEFMMTVANNAEAEYWTVGLGYDFGPFGTSVTYLDSEVSTVGSNEYEFQNLSLGVDYDLAPGVVPYIEANVFEFDEPVGGATDNEGTVVLVGTELTF